MTMQSHDDESAIPLEWVLQPQGHKARVTYGLRSPIRARYRARMWNRDDPSMFPPKAFGVGRTVNFYWVSHLASYVRGHRTQRLEFEAAALMKD